MALWIGCDVDWCVDENVACNVAVAVASRRRKCGALVLTRRIRHRGGAMTRAVIARLNIVMGSNPQASKRFL